MSMVVRISKYSTDYLVYKLLRAQHRSGEEIAAELDISRTAVWKAIEKLRSAGFDVDAKTRKGYAISSEPRFSPYHLADIVFTEMGDMVEEIYYFDVTTSTNEKAKEILKPAILLFAEEQSAGKGRHGRTWISPRGGLYFTITLKPELGIEDIPKVTLVTGLAVAKAIGGKIKWPNDVMIGGKKVCGILCELAGEVENPIIIIGIGINVENEIPEELKERAARLADFYSRSRLDVLRSVLRNFRSEYRKLRDGRWDEVRQDLLELCETLGRQVRVVTPAGVFEGIAEDIDESGALVVSGRKVYAGECIHLR